ncbi:MAG TPA: hypothetical protein VHC97_12585 [Thermoanaerobaculia bacterium]|jgi:hypothetical protein|nr:hypothetical protein [Thermoanaerobaculia bacterium]
MTRAHAAAAAKAFEETLEELSLPDDSPDLQDPAALGRRAALLAAADAVWSQVLNPLFDVEHTQTVLRVTSRQAVSDLAKRGRLLALDGSGGRKLYPGFQFGPDGRPYPEVAQVIRVFAGVVETPYTIASWFVSPQDLLNGETPAAWMRARREPEILLEAARRSADKLAH